MRAHFPVNNRRTQIVPARREVLKPFFAQVANLSADGRSCLMPHAWTADDNFAGNHLGQERDVLWVHAELAFNTGKGDQVGLFGEGGAVGSDDAEFHSYMS